MNLIWTKHIKDPEQKEKLEKEIRNSRTALDRLSDICKELRDSLSNQEETINDFDKQNWAYLQAFRNGSRATLKNMIEILNLDQGKKN